jgi:hypothetical protein
MKKKEIKRIRKRIAEKKPFFPRTPYCRGEWKNGFFFIKGVTSMLTLFRYNWQVREEWFKWCKQVPAEELLRHRVGGTGASCAPCFASWMWNTAGFAFLRENRTFRGGLRILERWRRCGICQTLSDRGGSVPPNAVG